MSGWDRKVIEVYGRICTKDQGSIGVRRVALRKYRGDDGGEFKQFELVEVVKEYRYQGEMREKAIALTDDQWEPVVETLCEALGLRVPFNPRRAAASRGVGSGTDGSPSPAPTVVREDEQAMGDGRNETATRERGVGRASGGCPEQEDELF